MSAVPFDELYEDELFRQRIDWSVDHNAVRAGVLPAEPGAHDHDWAYNKPRSKWWPTQQRKTPGRGYW